MTVLALFLLGLPLLMVGLVIGLVVLAVTRSRAPAPPPVVAPGPDGAWVPVPSTWNVEVHGDSVIGRMGGSLASTYGVLVLDRGRLTFTVDGASAPAWSVACRDVVVRRSDAGPFAISAVRLAGPMGELRCNVSRERINRMTRNSFKSFREAGYAGQFVAAAQAHGARLT